jgi:hypothetical protein
MKNLILLFLLVMLSFNSQSQCSEPKNTPWVLKDGVSNISTDEGFVIIVKSPEFFYDKGKTSFKKVERIKENNDSLYHRQLKYFYYFDFTKEEIYLYDCDGYLETYEINKVKHRNNTYFVTINDIRGKIKFKITLDFNVMFTQITYLKNKKQSEIYIGGRTYFYYKW